MNHRSNHLNKWVLALIPLFIFLAGGLLGIRSIQAQGVQGSPTPPPETPSELTEVMQRQLRDRQPAQDLQPMTATPCESGMAGIYPCDGIDLLAFMPLNTIGGVEGNDIWGWTDPLDGTEYALMGLTNGTSFVDISDPENPVYLGILPTQTSSSIWRDIKVYNNYAFIVADNAGSHGMQVFDLTQLRTVVSPPTTFSPDTVYTQFGSAHNIVINEDSGYAYAVGSSTCSGGLHMINIQNPLSPTFAGCYSSDGYTHDAQCVIYNGPDIAYQGDEVCFNSNEDTLTIVDVTDKNNPTLLSKTGYTGVEYTHQGWLTEDQTYFLLDDELDEYYNGHNTYTYIWDVSDLDNPVVLGHYTGPTPSIDHNLYTVGNLAYEANYRSGLHILDISDVANANLSQVGFFDVYPANDNPDFNGSWSVYPYFCSGVIVVSGIEQGLFILKQSGPGVGSVELSPPSQTLIGSPGETMTNTYTLVNSQIIPDSFSLALSGNSWATSVSADTGTVCPWKTTKVNVQVEIPANPNGVGVIIASDTFTLTATSDSDSNVNASATGTSLANVNPGVSLSPPQTGAGPVGTQLNYTFTVTNTGDYTDTYTLEANGVWDPSLSASDTGVLAAGVSFGFTLTVTVPISYTGTVSDVTNLLATSGLDPLTTATTSATTNMVLWTLNLPTVLQEGP
jgi:choice-of-anchor B domain-containing protein